MRAIHRYKPSLNALRTKIIVLLFVFNIVLNMDISVTVPHNAFKFEMCIPKTQMDGSMSQNINIGPSFDFIKCRNLH